jgi:hypothetical protein
MTSDLGNPLYQLAVKAVDVRAALQRLDWSSPDEWDLDAVVDAVTTAPHLGYVFALEHRLWAFATAVKSIAGLARCPIDAVSVAIAVCPLQIRRQDIRSSTFDQAAFKGLLLSLTPAEGRA